MRFTKSLVLLCIFFENVFPIDWAGKELATLERVKRRDSENQNEVTADTAANPCAFVINYESEVPDFRAPGRRISQVKCYEYIHGIKARLDQENINKKCLEHISRKNGRKTVIGIGGRDTLPGEFPHMGAIGWESPQGSWIFKCGGSLISEKFVLTAGHCIRAAEMDETVADVVPKIVRLGHKNIGDNNAKTILPTDRKIIRIIPHPNYKPPKKYFDIALMELEREVTFLSFIQPACLWTGPDDSLVGQNATITGWGVAEAGSTKTSPELQAAVIDVFDSDLCDKLLKRFCNRNWCGMQEHQICAGKLAGGADSCKGDSGGPLQTRIPLSAYGYDKGRMYYVIGVTSFGFKCGLPNTPGIYTRVSSVVDWVENVVWK